MKIPIDMNLSPLWVRFLSRTESRLSTGPRSVRCRLQIHLILDYAASNGFVIFTDDLDFGMLLAARKSRGPSVIQVRTQDVLPSAIGTVVLRAIEASREHLEVGAIVSVDLSQNRIRLLPIG
jgi:predicted nuclease of predicted toxin-antitoxin system